MDPNNLPPEVQQQLRLLLAPGGLPAQSRQQITQWLAGGPPPTDGTTVAGINAILKGYGLQGLEMPGTAAAVGATTQGQAPPPMNLNGEAAAGAAGAGAAAVQAYRATGERPVSPRNDGSMPETGPGSQVSGTLQQSGTGGLNTLGNVGTGLPPTGATNPVLPSAAPGASPNALDPSSILGGQLYSKSQEGDASSLDLLLVQTLQNLGLDPFSGSEAVKNVASSIQPYLKLFMEYSGLNDPGAAMDKGKQYADQFANIVSGPESYGKIRQWGADTLGGAKGLLGKMGQTDAQMNFVNDMLATQTAGGNTITNSALHNNAQANQTRFRLNMANDPRVSNYFDWLQKDKAAQADPMYAQLRSAFQR